MSEREVRMGICTIVGMEVGMLHRSTLYPSYCIPPCVEDKMAAATGHNKMFCCVNVFCSKNFQRVLKKQGMVFKMSSKVTSAQKTSSGVNVT